MWKDKLWVYFYLITVVGSSKGTLKKVSYEQGMVGYSLDDRIEDYGIKSNRQKLDVYI